MRKLPCILIVMISLLLSAALCTDGRGLGLYAYDAGDVSSSVDIDTSEFDRPDWGVVGYEVSGDAGAAALSVHLREKSDSRRNIGFRLVYDDENYEDDMVIPAGEEYGFLLLPGGAVRRIEAPEYVQPMANRLELHSGIPAERAVPVKIRYRILVPIIVLCLTAGIILWRSEDIYGWGDRFMKSLKACIKKPSIPVIVAACCLLLPLLLFVIPVPMHSRKLLFCFITGVILSALILFFRRGKQDVEKTFLLLAITAGCTLILIMPAAGGGWDTDMHYRYALQASAVLPRSISRADSLLTAGASRTQLSPDPELNAANAVILAGGAKEYAGSVSGSRYITHIPSGAGLAVAKLLCLGFKPAFMLGELVNLLAYCFLVYAGIKRLKSGKSVAAVTALIPSCIFLASTYGYDYWLLGFSIFGMCQYCGIMQDEGQARMKDVILMTVSLSLACVLKQNYLPFALIPFLLPKKKLKKPLRYYLLCALPPVLLLISLALRSGQVAESGGDMRGGTGVNAAEQLKFVLSDIPGFIRMLAAETLKWFSPYNISKSAGSFGNFGFTGIKLLGMLPFGLALAAAFIDREECDAGSAGVLIRGFNILHLFGGMAVIAAAFYLVYTPVGAAEILGVQPRYILPFVYPLMAVVGNGGIKALKEKPRLRGGLVTVILTASMAVFWAEAATLILPKVIY
ncbi:MAG: DUF2142 domain-containing protein [Lachnospiraceae bacterium]|nr:DUF2142 domain-containing protein [Lachnospiraceae bacterium]